MSKCLVCGNTELSELISFKKYPLCIGVLPQKLFGKVGSFPLIIGECNRCGHVQQIKILSNKYKKVLYKDEYSELLSSVPTPSETGINKEAKKSLDFFLGCNLPKGKILDIGCYDGYFLSLIKEKGYDVLGIEPNPISNTAQQKYGIKVINDFFSMKYFKTNSFDIIVLRNILEHLSGLNKFLKQICKALKPDGYILIEVPNVSLIFKKGGMGPFYHQHISYFSLNVLLRLLSKHSLRYVKSHEDYFLYLCVRKDKKIKNYETKKKSDKNLKGIKHYLSMKKQRIADLTNLLKNETNIAIFGAGGDATGLINALDENIARKIKYVYDNNKLKQGNLLAELPIKVREPRYLKKDKPDFLVISTQLHQNAIARQIKAMKIKRLKMISLFPKVRFIN